MAEAALRRQTPEVGARCLNWARRDLRGGRPVMGVPTANRLLEFGFLLGLNEPLPRRKGQGGVDRLLAEGCGGWSPPPQTGVSRWPI
ncbi:hypothetical protein EI171_40640 [Bradyrhizobium sp. LCT2]|nr:hypothetical protein EI171_40640 [Bradyrhizobium sp. LCT2]